MLSRLNSDQVERQGRFGRRCHIDDVAVRYFLNENGSGEDTDNASLKTVTIQSSVIIREG